MPEENVFAERLKLTRETLKLKQKEFAARLNISAASYSEIESGKYKPNYEFIYNLAKEFNVNLYYLLFGKGDMFLEPDRFIGT
jgi:transcriptional regulator with XRE-family HTH domain